MRRYLHFVTQSYSLSVIRPLARTIEQEGYGENLVFIAPKLKGVYDLPYPVCYKLSEALAFQPEVVFVPGNVVYPKLTGLKVQIFHGLCEEKGGHYKITGFFDLYCTSGPLITEKFLRLAQKYKHFDVVETGWPKVDDILAPYDCLALRQRFQIPENSKIILYAPTFSPKFKSTQKMLSVIEKLPRSNEIWFVKLHDLMDRKDKERFENINHPNIRFYEYHDNIPLLQLADLLISDTSSVVYEFILLDKPVITLGAKVRLQKGKNLNDLSLLREVIDHTLANPNEYKLGREEVIAQIHPYRDRGCARRVLDAVENFLDNNKQLNLKKKPINLFRKWQVYRQMKSWI